MSLQDIGNKRAGRSADPFVISWGWWFLSVPFLVPALVVFPSGEINPVFWKVLPVSTMLLLVAVYLYVRALTVSDLSVTVPILTFTPLLLLITSPLILGEVPRPLGIFGVLMIVTGSYMLNLRTARHGWLKPFRQLLKEPGPRYMLAVALIFSVSGNLDKIGVRASNPFIWIVSLNGAVGIGMGCLMIARSRNWREQIRRHWRILTFLGFCNAAALTAQMFAITQTHVPYLIAVKRTSVIFTAAYGFIILKEKNWRQRLFGIVLMVAGVFAITAAR